MHGACQNVAGAGGRRQAQADWKGFSIASEAPLSGIKVLEPPRYLAGPGWGLIRNDQITIAIEKEMERRDTWQGKFYKNGME